MYYLAHGNIQQMMTAAGFEIQRKYRQHCAIIAQCSIFYVGIYSMNLDRFWYLIMNLQFFKPLHLSNIVKPCCSCSKHTFYINKVENWRMHKSILYSRVFRFMLNKYSHLKHFLKLYTESLLQLFCAQHVKDHAAAPTPFVTGLCPRSKFNINLNTKHLKSKHSLSQILFNVGPPKEDISFLTII